MGRKEHTIHSFYFSQGKGSAVCNLHQFWHFVVKRRLWTIFIEQHAFWKNFDLKLFFFFFTFSCFPSRWQNVKLSVLSEIASLEIILLSVAIVNMSTQTPFKRIISVFYASWHLFVISLVLPPLYLMLRYTAAPFFTTTWSMTTTMTQIQGQCHNIPIRIRF